MIYLISRMSCLLTVHIQLGTVSLTLPAALGPGGCSAPKQKWEPGTEKNFLGRRARPSRKAYFAAIWIDCVDNVGSLTSLNPVGLHDPLQR
jgi:hypothetical protein